MSRAAPSEGRPAPRWTRKHSLIAGVFGVGLLVVAGLVLSLDEAPPDTRDLARTARPVAHDDNAFAQIVRAAQAIDRSTWASETPLYSDVARGKQWNAGRAAVWLAANDHLWPLITRAASTPVSQGPIPVGIADAAFPHIGQLRELAEIATLRAWHLDHKGEHEAALTWLATWLRAAQRIQDSNSTLIVFLTGLSMHASGRVAIETIVGRTTVSIGVARSLIQALEETRPAAPSLANALMHEHAFAQRVLRETTRKAGPVGVPEAERMFATSRYFPLLHKPNRTERLNAENFRGVVAQAALDWPALQAAIASRPPPKSGWDTWNPDNAAGRLLLSFVTPTLHNLLTKRLRGEAAISVAQAFIAARCFEAAKGELPADLAVTVPTLLTRLPLDPFSGGPIRYSREFRGLWSVGENHLDLVSHTGVVPEREVVLRIP